jgi:adenosylcobyric acid synthase
LSQKEENAARGVMVVGTSSNSGKSTVTTALCRILSDAGIKVAPFKAQNMSLESYVTDNGEEIARAQAVQALAARCRPTVQMNPILLKPMGDELCQVLLYGKPLGIMHYREYQARHQEMLDHVVKAFNELHEDYDFIVCEGAGSPAEINLLEHDIVNLPLAATLGIPAILVADIERGGAFASIYGTLAILPDTLTGLIRSVIINKMRGSADILEPAISWITDSTGIPCIGIIPYVDSIDMDGEDSLTRSPTSIDVGSMSRSSIHSSTVGRGVDRETDVGQDEVDRGHVCTHSDLLDVAVIGFPHLANATDIDPLRLEPDVSVRYVFDRSMLGDPDIVILPGSRNTVEDLMWIRSNGLAEALIESRNDSHSFSILGICAGYQILGKSIEDNIETDYGLVDGLSLLPVRTVMAETKILRRCQNGKWVAGSNNQIVNNQPVISGYEIHHGRLSYDDTMMQSTPWFLISTSYNDENEGCIDTIKGVCGTSVHGFLEDTYTRSLFLHICATRRNKHWSPSMLSVDRYRQYRIDKLASSVRQSIDMDALRNILQVDLTRHTSNGYKSGRNEYRGEEADERTPSGRSPDDMPGGRSLDE